MYMIPFCSKYFHILLGKQKHMSCTEMWGFSSKTIFKNAFVFSTYVPWGHHHAESEMTMEKDKIVFPSQLYYMKNGEEYICSNLNFWSIFTANIYLHSCIIKYIDILHIHFVFLITKICIYINTMGLCLCVYICYTHTHTHTHWMQCSCVCFPFSQAVSLPFHLGFYTLKCFSIPAIIGH